MIRRHRPPPEVRPQPLDLAPTTLAATPGKLVVVAYPPTPDGLWSCGVALTAEEWDADVPALIEATKTGDTTDVACPRGHIWRFTEGLPDR